jgi:hypothetical protein
MLNDIRRWIELVEAIVPDWILGDQFMVPLETVLSFNRIE